MLCAGGTGRNSESTFPVVSWQSSGSHLGAVACQSALIPNLEIRIAPALPLEQLFPPRPLRVIPVSNLKLSRVLLQIRVRLPLGDDSFEVEVSSLPEQPLAVVLNVVAIEEPITAIANDRSQSPLAVDLWQVSRVFTLALQ